LIQAAVRAGAILGGGTEDLVDRLDRYGGSIGLAFQVTDDILNVEGDPAVMGKAAGTDTTRNKNTYPALLGLEESKAFAEHLIQEALEALAGFDQKSDPLRAIARYILVRRR
ncbi:MAG: polyprenyl synthetase family protein, partial [Thermodesulfobacteriota bacterium]